MQARNQRGEGKAKIHAEGNSKRSKTICVYGRRETRSRLDSDQIKKSSGHLKEMKDWEIIIDDNHDGYISWDEYLKNQKIMDENNARTSRWGTRGKPLKGRGLLAGLLRCK